MSSVLIATINIFFSLILGAIALVVVAINFPHFFAFVLDFANWLEQMIGETGLKEEYNNWVRFLVSDQQLTYMFFTVAARIILAILISGGRAVFGRG